MLYHTMAGTVKFQVSLFDGNGNFIVWQCTIQDLLVQQSLDATLDDKMSEGVKESEWKFM